MHKQPSCFHCGTTTNDLKYSPLRLTNDHLYPRVIIPRDATISWKMKNQVASCAGCNNYKGRLHPLDWLVIMPNAEQAKKLAERLVSMGESMEAVFDAMRRRKR
jgi:hypothetical protein